MNIKILIIALKKQDLNKKKRGKGSGRGEGWEERQEGNTNDKVMRAYSNPRCHGPTYHLQQKIHISSSSQQLDPYSSTEVVPC